MRSVLSLARGAYGDVGGAETRIVEEETRKARKTRRARKRGAEKETEEVLEYEYEEITDIGVVLRERRAG